MANKRKPVRPVEPDTESVEEEDAGASSEPEQTQLPPNPFSSSSAKPQSHSSSQPRRFSSSDEKNSEPESDPPKRSSGARKSRSGLASAGVRVDRGKSGNGARNTRSKLVSEEEKETDGEKTLFNPVVWSEDDVIVILKGTVDYTAEMKANPAGDLDAFIQFIKKNLHADVTKRQLQNKMRRLKAKYENNRKKEIAGKEQIFPNPHEQILYDLSKSIWGKKDNGNGNENVTVSTETAEAPLSKRKGSERTFQVAKKAKNVEDMVLLIGDNKQAV